MSTKSRVPNNPNPRGQKRQKQQREVYCRGKDVKRVPATAYIDIDQYWDLDRLSKETRQSKSSIINLAINDLFARYDIHTFWNEDEGNSFNGYDNWTALVDAVKRSEQDERNLLDRVYKAAAKPTVRLMR